MKAAANGGRSFPQCSQFVFRLDGEARVLPSRWTSSSRGTGLAWRIKSAFYFAKSLGPAYYVQHLNGFTKGSI